MNASTTRTGPGHRPGRCRNRAFGARGPLRAPTETRLPPLLRRQPHWGRSSRRPTRARSARQLTHPARGCAGQRARLVARRNAHRIPAGRSQRLRAWLRDGRHLASSRATGRASCGWHTTPLKGLLQPRPRSAGGLCRNAPGWSPDGKRSRSPASRSPRVSGPASSTRTDSGLARARADPGSRRGGRLAAVVTRRPPARRPAAARKPPRRLRDRRRRQESASADALVSSRRRARLVPDGKRIVFTSNEDGPRTSRPTSTRSGRTGPASRS